jgi:hypothetical protein
MLNATSPPQTTQEILIKNLRPASGYVEMVTEKDYLNKHPGLKKPIDFNGTAQKFSLEKDQQEPGKKGVSRSLTATYYQGVIGDSVIRLEGSSNALPLDLELYSLLDLESISKKPDFETFFGELRLAKKIYKDLRLATRLTSISKKEDIARMGLRYAHVFNRGDAFSAEFYPVQTDGRQTLFLYGIKRMNGGKFFTDLYFKGVLDDFNKLERFYSEIGCGVSIVKRLEGVVQLRVASKNYKALLMGLRYAL